MTPRNGKPTSRRKSGNTTSAKSRESGRACFSTGSRNGFFSRAETIGWRGRELSTDARYRSSSAAPHTWAHRFPVVALFARCDHRGRGRARGVPESAALAESGSQHGDVRFDRRGRELGTNESFLL